MTIALSYDGILGRVQVALSGLPDGTVQVQRALNAAATDVLWQQGIVRGGRALPIESGQASLADAEFSADVENHYRTVPVDPPAGLLLSGTVGDHASTPDAAALDITGDIELVAWIRAEAVTGTDRNLAAKYQGAGVDERSYRFDLLSDGTLRLIWTTDGTLGTIESRTSTAPIPTADIAVKVTLNVDTGTGNHNVVFFTADSLDGPFTQLGSVRSTAGTTSIHAGTAELWVGGESNTGNQPFDGVIRAVQVRDGIDGTLVANPRFDQQADAATSFTDSAGLLWTVNGNAEILGIETDSITPSLDGEVWLKSIPYPGLNTTVTVSDYGDIQLASRTAAHPIVSKSLPVATTDLLGGRDHQLDLVSDSDADDAHIELMVRAGGVLFVHVPTTTGNALLPGSMHVVFVGRPVKHRIGGVSDHQVLRLPINEVEPPGPDVVGTTITWNTVRTLYGSWTAVISAHPDWRDKLQTVADPETLFVP